MAFLISSFVCALLGGLIGELVKHMPGVGALIGFGVNCLVWMIIMGGGEVVGDILGGIFD